MKNNKQTGFTLIEIMIVVGLLTILAGIAYPMYVEQLYKGKRSDAYAGLAQLSQLQEEYFLKRYSYARHLSDLGFSENKVDSPNQEYDLTLSSVTPSSCTGNNTVPCTGFVAMAVPNADAGQSQTQSQDAACQVFTLNHRGKKESKNSGGGVTTSECW